MAEPSSNGVPQCLKCLEGENIFMSEPSSMGMS